MKFKLKVFYLAVLLQFTTIAIHAQLAPDFTIDKNPAEYCMGDTVFIKNITSGNYKVVYWNFGDGTETYNIESPMHIYQNAGQFTVTLRVIFNDNSTDSTKKDITISESPAVTLLHDQVQAKLTASSASENLTFKWYFGNILTAESDSVVFYFESGVYKVIVTNSQGCSSTDSEKVTVDTQTETSTDITVKNNILTPDIQDGANDVLFIGDLGNFTNPCEIYIYNRWGKLVYSNLNYTNLGGFEGKDANGNLLDAGTYYYVVKSIGRKGGTGYIDLLR